MSISWNRSHPCPNCGGYAGAYKDAKRCRGFRHRDGEGYFCEQDNGTQMFDFSGYKLWFYKYDSEE